MRSTDDYDQAKNSSSQEYASEELLPLDPVLDRMENHEGENKPEQK